MKLILSIAISIFVFSSVAIAEQKQAPNIGPFKAVYEVKSKKSAQVIYQIGLTSHGLTVKTASRLEVLSPDIYQDCVAKKDSKVTMPDTGTKNWKARISGEPVYDYICEFPKSIQASISCLIETQNNKLTWSCFNTRLDTVSKQIYYARESGLFNTRVLCPYDGDPQTASVAPGVFSGFYQAHLLECADVLQDDYTFDAIKRLPKEELVGQIESKFPCKLTGENCTCVGVEVLRRQPVAVYSSTDAFFQYKTRCKYRFFHAPVSNVDFVLSRLGSADLEILRISE